jgi:hypothetical protein
MGIGVDGIAISFFTEDDALLAKDSDEDFPFAFFRLRTSWSRPWLNAFPVEPSSKVATEQQFLPALLQQNSLGIAPGPLQEIIGVWAPNGCFVNGSTDALVNHELKVYLKLT